METFYIWTIGCQMNFADSWRLGEELRRLGYREAERAEAADLVYFALVALARAGVDWAAVGAELDRRALKLTRRPGDAKPEEPRP